MNSTLRRSGGILVGLLLPVLAVAQAGKLALPDFSDLARKATEAVDITLDGDMLKSATRMLGGAPGRNSDTDLSGLVSGLKAISVRSFHLREARHVFPEQVEGVFAQVNAVGSAGRR